jgi:predicted methyltransferase
MNLDLSDWIPQDIYLTGDFEGTTSNIVANLVRPGDTMVDVGVNIGWFSLLFAQCVGASGKVLAYEPMIEISAKLHMKL